MSAFNKRRTCSCGCFGRCTFETVFRFVAWSARALLVGKYPERDWNGHRFKKGTWRHKVAGTWLKVRGAFLSKRGDWAWFKQALGLKSWQGSTKDKLMCWICNAGFNPFNNCYDFSARARWRRTRVTMSAFWAAALAGTQYLSPLFDCPGFTIHYCIGDLMHISCLGILQYLLGNILVELFKDLHGVYTNSQYACGQLENMMRLVAKDMGVDPPFHTLTLPMFYNVSKGKPKLKLKAAEGRHFLPIAKKMLETCFDCTSPHARLRLTCAAELCFVYQELEQWEDGGVSSARLALHGRRHLLAYAELCKQSANKKRWQMYPKHHLFCHVVEEARRNPRLDWCYSDEAEIGTAVELAKFAFTPTIPTRLLEKYRATFDGVL